MAIRIWNLAIIVVLLTPSATGNMEWYRCKISNKTMVCERIMSSSVEALYLKKTLFKDKVIAIRR